MKKKCKICNWEEESCCCNRVYNICRGLDDGYPIDFHKNNPQWEEKEKCENMFCNNLSS